MDFTIFHFQRRNDAMLPFRIVLACLGFFLSSLAYGQTQVTGTRTFSNRSATVNFTTIANQTAKETEKAKANRKFIDVEDGSKVKIKKKDKPPKGQVATLNKQITPQQASERAPIAPSVAALGTTSPDPSDSFLGFPGCCTVPPDTQGAVGPNHIVTATNGIIRIQSRTGQTIRDLLAFNFWQPALAAGQYCCDPRIWFDPYDGRWIMSAFARGPFNANGVPDDQILMAVSQTNDPTGNWNLYSYKGDPANLRTVDFPTLGFNRKWIVVAAHAFLIGTPTAGVVNQEHVFVVDKQKMYTGQPVVPSTLFEIPGTLDISPAATYDANLEDLYLVDSSIAGPTNSIRLSSVTGPVGSETLTLGLAVPTATTAWSRGGVEMPQLGGPGVSGADGRNAVYRNGSIWYVHSVSLPAASPNHAAVQWWQVSQQGLVQQRGLVEDVAGGFSYAAPSIAVNKNNDALIGYSVFSATTYPSAAYSFRAAGDVLNETRLPAVYKAGEVAYAQSPRWGDYSSTVVDPANDLDMWTVQEYAAPFPGVMGFSNWSVWWAKVSPPSNTSVACVKGSLSYDPNVVTSIPLQNAAVTATVTYPLPSPDVLGIPSPLPLGSVVTPDLAGNFCVDSLPFNTQFYLFSPTFFESTVSTFGAGGLNVYTSNTGSASGSCALPISCIEAGALILSFPQ